MPWVGLIGCLSGPIIQSYPESVWIFEFMPQHYELFGAEMDKLREMPGIRTIGRFVQSSVAENSRQLLDFRHSIP